MASVIQRGGKWYGKYRNEFGRWVRVALSGVRTRTQAKEDVDALERKARLIRSGVEKSIGDANQTLCDLCEWYLNTEVIARRVDDERARLKIHILEAPIGKKKLPAIVTDDIKAVLRKMHAGGYAAWTREGLRRKLRTIYNRAHACGKWLGHNPMPGVKPIRIPKKIHHTLRAEEVPLFLTAAAEQWRGELATSAYLALRMQEVFGLLKSQVDREQLFLRVEKSSAETEETKGGHHDLLPIPNGLVPYLEHALDTRPGPYLFPDPKTGKPRSKNSASKVVERTMKRAGLVEGYDHKCRRCAAKTGKAYVERHGDAGIRQCPICGFRLWPCAVARELSWHDLRDTTAKLLKKQGIKIEKIALILRHADIKLLEKEIYGETEAEDLREAVNSILASNGSKPRSSDFSPEWGPLGVQAAISGNEDATTDDDSSAVPVSSMVGATGFEPATTCTPSKCATRLRHAPKTSTRLCPRVQPGSSTPS